MVFKYKKSQFIEPSSLQYEPHEGRAMLPSFPIECLTYALHKASSQYFFMNLIMVKTPKKVNKNATLTQFRGLND